VATCQLLASSKYGSLINTQNNFGLTPLHVACQYGNVTISRLLLAAGAIHNVIDDDGRTPAAVASLCGHSELVIYLQQLDSFNCDLIDLREASRMLKAKDNVSHVTISNVVISQTKPVTGAERAKDNNKSCVGSKPCSSTLAKQAAVKSQLQKRRIV
jgi:ankyrin repeat protein